MRQFRCLPLACWTSRETCVARFKKAAASPRTTTLHGARAKPAALVKAGPCDGCQVGAAHARGERPETWPDGGAPIETRTITLAAPPPAPSSQPEEPSDVPSPSPPMVAGASGGSSGRENDDERPATRRWLGDTPEEDQVSKTRTCKECGGEFTPRHGPERYCGNPCISPTAKKKAVTKMRREAKEETRAKRRRRAAEHPAAPAEAVDPAKTLDQVWERHAVVGAAAGAVELLRAAGYTVRPLTVPAGVVLLIEAAA